MCSSGCCSLGHAASSAQRSGSRPVSFAFCSLAAFLLPHARTASTIEGEIMACALRVCPLRAQPGVLRCPARAQPALLSVRPVCALPSSGGSGGHHETGSGGSSGGGGTSGDGSGDDVGLLMAQLRVS